LLDWLDRNGQTYAVRGPGGIRILKSSQSEMSNGY
jgi:hypothetical protein